MSDSLERFSLGTVEDRNGELQIDTPYDVSLSFEEYSRFKYGDGAVSRIYGAAMAKYLMPLLIEQDPESPVYITSSAYKIARPASASLVEPFVGVAQAVAYARGHDIRIVPFKINRANLTDGDYAAMSLEQRQAVMDQNGLSLPPGVNIEGSRVVAIDDIRVTGSHEESLDAVLRSSGVSELTHAYVVEVADGNSSPVIESVINGTAVHDVEDLIALASVKHFAANARFGKRILTESAEDITHFVNSLSLRITSRLINDAIGDGLDTMDRYKHGFRTMVDTFSERVMAQFE